MKRRLSALLFVVVGCAEAPGAPPSDLDGDGVSSPEDCDDGDATRFPGANDAPYDQVDQDCDGRDLVDVDRDGADALEAGGGDCDDHDDTIGPAAAEVPYDGTDQDCDGEDLTDVDGDGVDGIPAAGDDCDDTRADVFPGAPDEVGIDGVDNDCDGIDGVDADLDGFASRESRGQDCDDADPAVNPDAVDTWYDGADPDCDRACDYDRDGDGAVPAEYRDLLVPLDDGPCDGLVGAGVIIRVDCDDSDPQASDAVVHAYTPVDGAVDVDPEQPVVASLLQPENGVQLVLTDPLGAAVPGTIQRDNADYLFFPDAPLEPLTTYTVSITYSCGVGSASFTTAPAIVPVDPAALVGTTWALDGTSYGSDTVVPTFFGGPYSLDRVPTLIEVIGAGPTTLDLRLSAAVPTDPWYSSVVQDRCFPAVDVLGVDFSANPTFTVEGDLPFVFTDLSSPVPAMLQQGRVTATIRGTRLYDAVFSGLVDTEDLTQLYDPALFGAPTACALLAGGPGACVPCPDGDPTCVRTHDLFLEGYEVDAALEAEPTCP